MHSLEELGLASTTWKMLLLLRTKPITKLHTSANLGELWKSRLEVDPEDLL